MPTSTTEPDQRLAAPLARLAELTARFIRPPELALPDGHRLKWEAVKARERGEALDEWNGLVSEVTTEAYSWLVDLIHSRLRPESPARDEGSTTYIAGQLYDKIRREFQHGRVPPTPPEFAAFAAANIKRVICDLSRKAVVRRQSQISLDGGSAGGAAYDPPGPGPTPDEFASALDELDAIYRRVETLPQEDQRLFELKFVCQMSHRAIAAALGCAHSTVNARVAGLRELLRGEHAAI